MTKSNVNYRKIYEQSHGPIPIDETGRTYDVHHIDGNRRNNNPSNLKAVSINEHYHIHFVQEDFGACIRIAQRMNMSVEHISNLSRMLQESLVAQGAHYFQKRKDGTSYSSDREKDPNYKNPWKKRDDGSSVTALRYQNGWKSPFCKKEDGSSISSKREKDPNYKNPWKKRDDGSSAAKDQRKDPNYKEVFSKREDGTSVATDLLRSGKHPSQVSWICVCGKQGKGKGNFTRFHDKCSSKFP